MNPIRFIRDLTMGLITSKDGSYSLTKLAATTFHFNLAVAVSWHTYTKGFAIDVWILYGTLAVGHATFDKTSAIVNAFKSKQMEKANADPTEPRP
jgi:hypothetical protein